MTTASYPGDRPPISDEEPGLINCVLTFEEPDGKRWLAGALLGPLQAAGDPETRMLVSEMIDRPIVISCFTVVRDDRQ